MDKNKTGLSGLACFLAFLIATALFITEYVVGVVGTTWGHYLAIARDVAVAIGILFGAMGYVKGKNFFVKLLFALSIIAYIVFAFLVPLMVK